MSASPGSVELSPEPGANARSGPSAARVQGADAVALAALAGYVFAVLLAGPARAAVAPVLELAGSVAAAVAMLAVAARLRRRSLRAGRAWTVLAAAFVAYAAGDALWVVGGATLGGHPLSLATHGAYLLFYPLFLAGVLGLPRVALGRDERLELLLDAALVVLAAGSALWSLPLRAHLLDLPTAKVAVTLAYPLADLVLVWAVLVLTFRRQVPGGGVATCLAASALTLVVADVLFSTQVLLGPEELAPWSGVLFFASHLLAVLAAVRQLRWGEEDTVPLRARAGDRSLAVAWAALACAWVVVVSTQLPRISLPTATVVTAALGLVAARQMVAVRETRRLYARLCQANERLEERVNERTGELGAVNQELRRRVQELTVLSAVSAIAVDAQDEDGLIERATAAIRSSLFPDNCGVLLLDEARGQLHHTPSFHSRVGPGPHQVIPLGRGITGAVAASGQPRRVGDAVADPDYLAADPEMRSEVCVPLKVGGRVLGVVDAESRRPNAFSASDELVLGALAGQLATALDRLRGGEQLRRQLERLAGLRAIDNAISSRLPLAETLAACLDQARQQLGADAAAVLLTDNEHGGLRVAGAAGLPPGFAHEVVMDAPCHAGRAAIERRTVLVRDLCEPGMACGRAPELMGAGFTATAATPLLVHGEVAGVLEVYLRGELPSEPEWTGYLEALAGQAAIAVDNRLLFERLERGNLELAAAYDTTLEGWSRALELRDQETQGHTARVASLAVALARAVGIPEEDIVHVRRGALLHDIGKMGIPDSILLKPGPLDEEEWRVMRSHPVLARRLLEPIPFLAPALDIPYGHHERWDGSGYPRGLAGERIPLAARVFAVVDVWDALSHDRPYRAAWPPERVLAYLREESGRTLDARVVEALLRLLGRAP